jgi:hypothetical protein
MGIYFTDKDTVVMHGTSFGAAGVIYCGIPYIYIHFSMIQATVVYLGYWSGGWGEVTDKPKVVKPC